MVEGHSTAYRLSWTSRAILLNTIAVKSEAANLVNDPAEQTERF